MPGQSWTLFDLIARWLPTRRPRYNVGFSFDCPRHPESHRLQIRFLHPYDGDPPIQGSGPLAVVVANGGLHRLTLKTGNGGHCFDFGMCGEYAVIEGRVEECEC